MFCTWILAEGQGLKSERCFLLKLFVMGLCLPRAGHLFLIFTKTMIGLGLPRHLSRPLE